MSSPTIDEQMDKLITNDEHMEMFAIGEEMEEINFDEQNDKFYEKINEHYKTINHELIKKIVQRFNKIIDLYFDFAYAKTYAKSNYDIRLYRLIGERKYAYLTKRLTKNERWREALTIESVLTLIDMVFNFMSIYDNKCTKLFHYPYREKWLRFDANYCIWKEKFLYRFNDYNIPSTMERFFNISDREIWCLLIMNFPFDLEKATKYKVFDGIRLPYPPFKNEK